MAYWTETLVVCMAEFGRTPRLDGNGGRGHWGSVFLGHPGGRRCQRRPGLRFVGPDRRLPPLRGVVRPEDLSATIFHCLGYSPQTDYHDPLGRPHPISRGEVLHAIL